MASPEAIATASDVVVSDQTDYKQKLFAGPSYKFNAQFNNTFGQSINLGVSTVPITINIPPEVMNMGGAILDYEVILPGVVGATGPYIWSHAQLGHEGSYVYG